MGLRRVYYESTIYHVMVRSNNKEKVMIKENDKKILLEKIAKYKDRFGFKLYGFVIMDNHFHMVIEVNMPHTISTIMQALLLSYSSIYRHKYEYEGYVWQGRFKSWVIQKEQFLTDCLDYIHSAPVKNGIAQSPSQYKWSSAFYYQGIDDPQISDIIKMDHFNKAHTLSVMDLSG